MLSFLIQTAQAAPNFTGITSSYEENFYGEAKTLGEMIGSLINILLSVAGFVLFFLLIYAGILWMTAGGKDEQVSKAKNILVSSIIGLVIILMSLALSTFVQNALISPEPDTAPSQQTGGGGYNGQGPGGTGNFQVEP